MPKAQTEFAPGIPISRAIEPIPSKKAPEVWEFGVHRHVAERAGEHYDLRLGDPQTGQAHSWALRHLPKPGEMRLAVQQPTHTMPYMDFKGRIESPYGRGSVELARRDKAEVLRAGQDEVRFNLYPGKEVEEYALRRTDGNRWLLQNVTTTRQAGPGAQLPSSKPSYKNRKPEQLQLDDPQTELQAKIDGAHVLYQFKKPGQLPRVVSYRPAERATGLIEHTHKLPGFQTLRTPPELRDTILRGELYAVDQAGKALPAARVGGILNAGVWKSREKQVDEGELVPIAFDIVKFKGKDVENEPYEVKKKLLETVYSLAPWLKKPRTATTPTDKAQLMEDIRAGREPSTEEGVIEWRLDKPVPAKAKFLAERDVFVRNIFPETGTKRQGTMAGGFEYSTSPKGQIVGRVGTGFSHALKKDMLENPSKYEGLRARVTVQRAPAHYAPRAAAFHSFHLDQDLPEEAKTAAVDPAEWIASNVKKPKNKCFFYSAALAALNPELKLYKGQHSGQFKGDTGHFYLKGPGGTTIDPTAAQYPKGRLVSLGERVSVRKNLDYVIRDPLFNTLSKEDQQTIRNKMKTASATVTLRRHEDGGVAIEKLHVPESERGQGKARQLISHIKDKYKGANIHIRPRPFGDMPMSIDQLKSFYQSEGFQPIDGRDNMVLKTASVGFREGLEKLEREAKEQLTPEKAMKTFIEAQKTFSREALRKQLSQAASETVTDIERLIQ